MAVAMISEPKTVRSGYGKGTLKVGVIYMSDVAELVVSELGVVDVEWTIRCYVEESVR